jgi:hypothetical protein
MVYKQVILCLLTIVIGFSCNNEPSKALHNESISIYTEEKNDKYCFNNIFDSLNKNEYLDNIRYYKISDKKSLKNFFKDKYYLKSIENFYEYNSFIENYFFEHSNKKYLILIGQAKGATGIGVNYWNYECILLTERSDIIKFSSLSRTPFSIYLNDKGRLFYLEVLDNYPRPASGEEIKLDYYPVIARLVNENGNIINKIEYDCK